MLTIIHIIHALHTSTSMTSHYRTTTFCINFNFRRRKGKKLYLFSARNFNMYMFVFVFVWMNRMWIILPCNVKRFSGGFSSYSEIFSIFYVLLLRMPWDANTTSCISFFFIAYKKQNTSNIKSIATLHPNMNMNYN